MNTVMIYRGGEALPVIPAGVRFLSRRWANVALLLTHALILLDACADDFEVSPPLASFDQNTLQQRGIDPALATLLLAAPRFTGGKHPVTLTVNGSSHGRVDVTFNQQGAVCFDHGLLDAAKISVPASEDVAHETTTSDQRCHDVLGTWPQTLIEHYPASLGLSLIVPTDAIRPTARDMSGYQTGGIAGVFNYDATSLYSHYGGTSSRYASANTELGFNASDWIVRSRQIQTWQDGTSRVSHLEAYAQRTFARQAAVLQAGQLNLYNPVLAGAQITGVQVLTEQALQAEGQRTTLEGIAYSQAQVDVRQNGALIHSTVVPAGPFSLNNVRRLNSRSDVEVTVRETNGSERSFTIPATMLGVDLPAPGYSLAAGKLRNLGDPHDDALWVVSGGWSGALQHQVMLSAGLTGAADYSAAGLGLGLFPWSDTLIQTTLQGADTRGDDSGQGLQADLSLSQRLSEQWSANAGISYRTYGYRELEDAVGDSESNNSRSRYRDQQNAALAWSHPWLGGFSAGLSRSNTFDDQNSSRALASWGTHIRGVAVSVTAEWQVSGEHQSDDALYLSMSIPLGENRRGRTWVRNSGGEHRSGVGLSDQVNDQFGYRVGVEHDTRDQQMQSTAGVSLLPRYSQLDFNYTRSDAESSSYQASARGGAVLHGGGVTLSPYPVSDTFALLSIGEMNAIKITTPSGPVWTDGSGQAVVPQLTAYGNSPVEVDTRSLPRNADISNGMAVISAGRGAVDNVQFGVTLTRRALLHVTTGSGEPLPRGATVTTEDGEFVTLVQDGGRVFLPNVLDRQALWITAPDRPRCQLQFALPTQADTHAYYETVVAQCHPL